MFNLFTPYKFITTFSAQITADGKYWITQKPLIYNYPDTNTTIFVPKGFVTDLASIPRLFWVVFPPCGKYTPAAVVHDYLYWEQPEWCSREKADLILLKAMEESNVDEASRIAIYRAVRTGGGSAWRENAKKKRSGTIRFVPDDITINPTDTWSDIESRIRSSKK